MKYIHDFPIMITPRSRLWVLKLLFAAVFGVFFLRLFQLQIIQHDALFAEAKLQHEKRSILPARRGKILVKKSLNSEDLVPLATNNTLKMLFVDPVVLAYPQYNPNLEFEEQERGDPSQAARLLAPLLIHAHCESIEGCKVNTDIDSMTAAERAAVFAYEKELEHIFLQTERTRVVIDTGLAADRLSAIESLQLAGIFVEGDSLVADPTRINDTVGVAQAIAPVLNRDPETIEPLLHRRLSRYREITHKIVPEVSQKIEEMKADPTYSQMLRGVGLTDEYWRYYPEKELASQVLGFLDSSGRGQYGIEGRFDHLLRGQEGMILGATSVRGQRLLGEGSQILRAQDGADIVLTIDRVIQSEVEKILRSDLERFDADFGQIIVVQPSTGKILAMAQAPTFDPNEFGKVFQRYEVPQEVEEADRADPKFNQRIPSMIDEGSYYRYFNKWGPQVFRNKMVVDTYEPGSVMKAITMASALNANEVTPDMTYEDTGPVEVDEFKIRNSDNFYAGTTSMISVLNRSLNTGIAFITQKMGSRLMYEYLTAFGFGQYSDVQVDGEASGHLEFWQDWSPSELVTRGFGQGVTATPLQMAMAFSVLANDGYLMKPILVEEIRTSDGEVQKFVPERVRKVISDKTYHTIKSMLLNVVDNGGAKAARVPGYTVMGKTGTSQTYDSQGEALEGLGTTISTFAGFGPIKDPAFVVLVKYDYPKASQWGSETAALTFQQVAEFLFSYFEIPPDR